MLTAVIRSPSKVTWTCTGPLSVRIVVPLTTVPDEVPGEADADGVVAGAAVEAVAPADGS
jgi:hypothetical protein